MFGLKKLRFVDLGTGLSLVIGTAGMLVSSALHAAEPESCVPAPSRPVIQGGGCCDKIYDDAAERLKNLNPGCCSPGNACAAPGACAPAAAVSDPAAVFNGCGSGSGSGCGNGGGNGCGGGGCGFLSGDLGEPWTAISLFDDECGKNRFKDNGWVFGGHTQFGYQSNPDGAFAGNGPFVSQKEYKFLGLNQQYMYLGKVADGSNGFDWGFRGDLMYGLDGNEGQSFGNINPGRYDYLNGWDRGAYEWALPQLYVEVAYQNLSVKLGHFYTPTGYEVVPSTGNFFMSHQLTWYNSEAFTHTGALATYKANDKWTFLLGWSLGWDTGFYQYAGGNNAILGATYTISDKTNLIYFGTYGDMGWRGTGHLTGFILSHKWTDKWSTVTQGDVFNSNLGSNFNGNPTDGIPGPPGVIEGVTKDSISLLNYTFYDITPKLKAGIRNEWYRADGVSYQTHTAGFNIKPSANLTIRPEVRYNYAPGNTQTYTGPAYSGQLFNQTVFGVDAILAF